MRRGLSVSLSGAKRRGKKLLYPRQDTYISNLRRGMEFQIETQVGGGGGGSSL